jgi:hypothetical protein
MDKKVNKLRAHVRKVGVPAVRGRVPKVLPLEAWRFAVTESNPPPASHFGCVDWYMYEHCAETKTPTGGDER